MCKMVITLAFWISVAGLILVGFTSEEIHRPDETCTIRIDSELDQSALQALEESAHCDSLVLRITSIGGEGLISLQIAHKIKNYKSTVIIDNYCFSACAEFILPAADEVIFEKAPLIGFHGNPAMKEYLANATEPQGYQNCAFKEADSMYDLYFDTTVNYEFWKSQLEKLELQSFGVEEAQDGEVCPKMGFNFKHAMWFPSSEALQRDFGLAFNGAVCADKLEKCSERVFALFDDRGTFVIDQHVVDSTKKR